MKRICSIPSTEILSLFLPQGILDYFDIVDYDVMDSCYVLSLCEKPLVSSRYSSLPLVSKGFYPEILIQDFPARGRSVCLKVRRRRWEDKHSGKTYSRDRSPVASGPRITTEFDAFLKELP